MAAVTSVAITRTWANIVKGDTACVDTASETRVNAALQPAARGERKCTCHGEFLVMLGHYGWIMALDEIDHPDVGQNGGRIYVHKRDLLHNTVLPSAGDRVVFYLYADDQGLGAEACRLAESEPGSFADDPGFGPSLSDSILAKGTVCGSIPSTLPVSHLDADDSKGNDFDYPQHSWNASATEFTPSAAFSMNACAKEFVPKAMCMNATAAEFVPQALSTEARATECAPGGVVSSPSIRSSVEVMAINLAYISDDSDSEDEDLFQGPLSSYINVPPDAMQPSDIKLTERINDLPTPRSDSPSEVGSVVESEYSTTANEWDTDLEAVVLCAPLKNAVSASKRAVSSDGSTSASACASDSEEEEGAQPMRVTNLPLPPGFRPPPGLELLAPPGL